MEVPPHLMDRFERAKCEFKQSICKQIDDFKLSMCRKVDSFFDAILQEIKSANPVQPQDPHQQLASYLSSSSAIPVIPVLNSATGDYTLHLDQSSYHHQHHHQAQNGAAGGFFVANSETVPPKPPTTTAGGQGDSNSGDDNSMENPMKQSDTDYSSLVNATLLEFAATASTTANSTLPPDFEPEDAELSQEFLQFDPDPGEPGDIGGNNLYWINPDTEYKSALISGKFSVLSFDFGLTATDPAKRWTLQPADAIRECQRNRGPTDKFPDYFKYFTNDIFKRLGNIFPYEVSRPVIEQVCTVFCAQFRQLDYYFQLYKKKYPNAMYAKCVNTIELLAAKLKNKFKIRSTELKKEGLWAYRPHEKDKYGSAQAEETTRKSSSRRRWKPDTDFDYAAWKSKLEEKMDQYLEEKERWKQSRRGGKRGAPKKRKPAQDDEETDEDDYD